MSKSRDAFRTISEVSEWLDTPAHVLRFWESKFTQVKPVKRAGGRRYYRPADMELLGGIKKLLHEDGMTIKGVQKVLREQGVKYVTALSPQSADEEDAPDGGDLFIEDAPFAEMAESEESSVVAFRRDVDPESEPEDPVKEADTEAEADEALDVSAEDAAAPWDASPEEDDASALEADDPLEELAESAPEHAASDSLEETASETDEDIASEGDASLPALDPLAPLESTEAETVTESSDVAEATSSEDEAPVEDDDAPFLPFGPMAHQSEPKRPQASSEREDNPPLDEADVPAAEESETSEPEAEPFDEPPAMAALSPMSDAPLEDAAPASDELEKDGPVEANSEDAIEDEAEPLDPKPTATVSTAQGLTEDDQPEDAVEAETFDAPEEASEALDDAPDGPSSEEDAPDLQPLASLEDDLPPLAAMSEDETEEPEEPDAPETDLPDLPEISADPDETEPEVDESTRAPASSTVKPSAPPARLANALHLPDFSRPEEEGPDDYVPGLLGHLSRIEELSPDQAQALAALMPALRRLRTQLLDTAF